MREKIAISGKIASGKSTASKILESLGYYVFSIGNEIKRVSSYLVLDILTDENQMKKYMRKNELKSSVKALEEEMKRIEPLVKKGAFEIERRGNIHYSDTSSFERIAKNNYSPTLFVKTDAYRQLLQNVANIVRKDYGDDIWVRVGIQQALANAQKIVCDDLRLKEEKKVFEEEGFSCIRLDIDKKTQRERVEALYGEIDESVFAHQTEVDLDDEEFDLHVHTGYFSEEQMTTRIQRFVKEEKNILDDIKKLAADIPIGTRDDWHEYFMGQAYMASFRSTCGSRRVGAVIVKGNRQIATGYNGNPPGDDHCIDGGCPRFQARKQGIGVSGQYQDEFPCYAFHAEANALFQMSRQGISTEGAEMYTTTFPCRSCAEKINGSGIKRVYYSEGYPDLHSKAYLERYGIQTIKI